MPIGCVFEGFRIIYYAILYVTFLLLLLTTETNVLIKIL